MTTEPTLAVQLAVVTRLTDAEAVQALVPERVYDRVPKGTVPPYVRVGNPDRDVPNKAECYDGSEVFLQIDAFGDREQVGKPGVKRIAGAVIAALDECEDAIDIEDYRLLVLEKFGVEFRTEPDGLTEHAIMTFRALVEPK